MITTEHEDVGMRNYQVAERCGSTSTSTRITAKSIASGPEQENMYRENDNNSCEQKEIHIAPMLAVTTTEFHHFFRILSKRCVLWTEMVVDETINYTDDLDHYLAYHHEIDDEETNMHPIICQIGGKNPTYISNATKVVEQYGYDECNINFDCPSSRVSGKRKFGAILMKEQEFAISAVQAMHQHCSTPLRKMPISIKTRVGIDEFDSMEFITSFLSKLKDVGCTTFYIHARKCILGGLTPSENRLVPALNYPRVFALCHHFPDCNFIINGGIPGLKAAKLLCYGTQSSDSGSEEYKHNSCIKAHEPTNKIHSVPCSICNATNGSCTAPLDVPPPNLKGCMLGRAAMDNPSMFWDTDRYFYGCSTNPCRNRREALNQYLKFLERAYPRRCCDNDERITRRIPSPNISSDAIHGHSCSICQEYYGVDEEHGNNDMNLTPNESKNSSLTKVRISSCVIDRSLKPILGIFFGMKKSKAWRRTCDILSRDMTVRNCGPGYILRKAMDAMPPEVLDEDFILTENIDDEDLPVHVGPKNPISCCS